MYHMTVRLDPWLFVLASELDSYPYHLYRKAHLAHQSAPQFWPSKAEYIAIETLPD